MAVTLKLSSAKGARALRAREGSEEADALCHSRRRRDRDNRLGARREGRERAGGACGGAILLIFAHFRHVRAQLSGKNLLVFGLDALGMGNLES